MKARGLGACGSCDTRAQRQRAGLLSIYPHEMRRMRLGASHTAWDDPQTPGALLAEMVEREPRALTNPNMPLPTLQRYAWRYPQYIEENPALELLELEDPAQVEKLRREFDAGWVNGVLGQMKPKDRYRLNIRFARLVTPLYEQVYQDDQVRALLNEALAYLQGGHDIEEGEIRRELSWMRDKAKRILDDLHTTTKDEAAGYAMLAAARVFDRHHPGDEENCAGAVRHAVAFGAGVHNIFHRGDVVVTASDEVVNACYENTRKWQADLVREAWLADQHAAARQAAYEKLTKLAAKNAQAAIEAAKARTATKAEIAKAVKQAKASAAQIQQIMRDEDPESWPAWVGLGCLAAGAVVALIIGPEALAAAGVAGAAGEIIGIAEAADVETVSVAGLEGFELAELAVKLRNAGLVVTTAAAEVVAKVAR